MLNKTQKLALFAEASMGTIFAKMAEGILRYIDNPISCVVDSTVAGQRVKDVCTVPSEVPIVASIDEALALGAEVLVLGTAPAGGRLPDDWLRVLDYAVGHGMSIINGLHDRLNDRYQILPNASQWIWDTRSPNRNPPAIASGAPGRLNNTRLLFVGTDMAVGKMTVGLEIFGWLRRKNISSAFLATGQIGITITGTGIPLDGIKVDYASGAVEEMVMAAADRQVILIEGQGSLLHPGSTATLPLMRGSAANRLIMCHKAGATHLDTTKDPVAIPPLKEFIQLNEAVASACGALTPAKTIGVAVNTSKMPHQQAVDYIANLEDEVGLPVQDVVRFGPEKLASYLL